MQKGFPMKTLRLFIFSSLSFFIFFLTTAFCLSAAAFAASADAKSADARPADGPAPKGWNAEVKTIHYRVEADQSWQPALFYVPESVRESQEAVPLIVGLHTWSGGYTQANPYFYEGAKKYGWVMICPHFRGPNWTPSACGSELVSADILAAVEYAKANANIDPDRIYLMGMSGGGHCSMLMAGRHPEVWAGVCAWVGISDLAKWHASTKAKGFNYWKHLESACGGAPGTSAEVDEEYRKRSPLTYLKNAGSVPLCLNHGIHDGHAGSVPAAHSIWAFNLLAEPEKKVSDAQIDFIWRTQTIPEELLPEAQNDPQYGKQKVLFRRTSGNTRLTIFDGGHSGVPMAGFAWLAKQKRNQPADWTVGSPTDVKENQEVHSGK